MNYLCTPAAELNSASDCSFSVYLLQVNDDHHT